MPSIKKKSNKSSNGLNDQISMFELSQTLDEKKTKKTAKKLKENEEYLTSQIITYIGNKRALLDFIGEGIEKIKLNLGKTKLDIVDIFSGSGIVARYFKQHANNLYVNDLEGYSKIINECYLTNKDEVDFKELEKWKKHIKNKIEINGLEKGFIAKLYAPANMDDIKSGERVFYTPRNAMFIDTARKLIDDIPPDLKKFFISPLLAEASKHNNTSGVFKGFYKNSTTGIGQYGGDGKNALTRILGDIELQVPVFSNFKTTNFIYQEDANLLVEKLPEVDVVYMDPPYNQHPYGSNYFMLNLINEYVEPTDYSSVSGIPKNWKTSKYNKKKYAKDSMFDLCSRIKSKFLLISFNSEGFISLNEMLEMLTKIGEVEVLEMKYNTFRGSRNLGNRNIHVKEYLYIVKKENN